MFKLKAKANSQSSYVIIGLKPNGKLAHFIHKIENIKIHEVSRKAHKEIRKDRIRFFD